jgi:hypothetical protein
VAGLDCCRYNEIVHEQVARFVEGFNTCIIVHGESGAGKTHSVMGSEDVEPGFLHWIFKDLFGKEVRQT